MPGIVDIEGIGEVFTKKLKSVGISTTEALLEAGGTAKGRTELASKTGISEAKILEWVNRSDLYRIKGVGSEYSDLLEAAGVDTVVELAKRVPANSCQNGGSEQSQKAGTQDARRIPGEGLDRASQGAARKVSY